MHNLQFPFSFSRYRLGFIAETDAFLPEQSGSAWRGAFGHSLKRALCVTREPTCEACLLRHSCPYSYIFETPPPQNSAKMRKYPATPHPFVLLPDLQANRAYKPGDPFHLTITLVGKANLHLPYFVYAFQKAAEWGIGKGKGRFRLVAVEQEPEVGAEQWVGIGDPQEALQPLPSRLPTLPEMPTQLTVALLTPFHAKQKNALVQLENFTFAAHFSTLMRRISLLDYFHGAGELENMEIDFRDLFSQAEKIELHTADLR